MITVGVRELKEQTSHLLRQVREEGETVLVTYHGKAIARLIPMQPATSKPEELTAVWTEIDQLAAEIGEYWPETVSAVAAVNEDRREL